MKAPRHFLSLRGRQHCFAAIIVGATLLAGCAIGPNYRRPQVDVPARFRGQTDKRPVSFADLPWWRVFKDPTLQALIAEGLRNNDDLRIAVARIEQARARRNEARSLFFPQIGYTASANQTKLPHIKIPSQKLPSTMPPVNIGGATLAIPPVTTPEIELGNQTVDTYIGSGVVSWEIDLWGSIRRTNEAALARLLATKEARRGVVQMLVAEVAQTYFDLRELDLEREIAKRAEDSFAKSLELFTNQKTGGVASGIQVSRASAARANAAATIPEIERRIAVTENKLCFLLGRNPGPISRGQSLGDQQFIPSVPAGIPAALLARRPDLRQAEMSLVAANAQIGVAEADFLPKIDLTAAAGAVNSQLQLLKISGEFWNLGANATGPIFQGGRLLARFRESKAQWKEARAQYNQTALNAFGEVSNALISRQKLVRSRIEREKQVSALRDSVRIARDRFQLGLANYYELLEAQQQLFPAESALAQTQLNQQLAIVELYKALGGGWDNGPTLRVECKTRR